MEGIQKLILVSKVFGGVPSFKKVPDFLSGWKSLKLLLTNGRGRGITAPSNDIIFLSYPFDFSLCKIFVKFIFLLNQDNHFSGNNMPDSASLKIINYGLSPMNLIGPIKCDRNRTRNFRAIHDAHTVKIIISKLIWRKRTLKQRLGLGIGLKWSRTD